MADSYSVPAIVKEACWIWPESFHWDLNNCYALFRKGFSLAAVPSKAPLYITADQSYQLYVNGHYVCRGPARGFQGSWPLDAVDVRPWLKKGKNCIAVRAYNPGSSSFQYVSQGYAGLLLAAHWGKTKIISNLEWKCRRQSGVSRDMQPTSLQLFYQESIDLNREPSDWLQPGYDDSAWSDTKASKAWDGMPWYRLEARDIPFLEEKEIPLGPVVGTARGGNFKDYRNTRNLALLRYEEGLAHQPAAEGSAEIEFAACRKGRWSSRLIDMGKLHVGSMILEIEGAEGGEIVECHHYETLSPGTLTPDFNPKARIALSHRLICRPGLNRHAFYHPFGFRYLVLTVRDNKGPLIVRPCLRTAWYPLKIEGAFDSSDPALNAIWETCSWTQRMCSLDAYVDTPWREQAQWWGDARVQAWNTFHLSNDARLLRRGIRQIAAQTAPDGVTYGHAPTKAHACILPDFTLIWILTLWDYYWQTGSLDAFQENQSTLTKALNYFHQWTDEDTGLLRYDRRFWLFLDWTQLDKHGCSSVYSLWYLHALDRLVVLYKEAGQPRTASRLDKRARKLRLSLRKLVNGNGLISDGYMPTGRINPHCSVHAQTLAIMTGLVPGKKRAMLEGSLLPEVTGKNPSKVRPSAYWITYVYDVLANNGYATEVVDDIRNRWSPMVEQGTTWENFQPARASESFSHAWSAHPLFHLMQILGGVRQTAPAWKEILCAPLFHGEHAEASIPTPQGLVRSSWKRNASQIKGQLELPKGVRAKLRLPGQDDVEVQGKFRYTLHAGV